MELSKLTQKRKNHVDSCSLNGDNSHSIIANLYSDSTHFIYELIQNAQDSNASFINFVLFEDRLEIYHNGKAFIFLDIESITIIGSSTKSNETNKIGKFGAGFKSVFSITDTPYIYSGRYNFKIDNFIIPYKVEPLNSRDESLTTIVLPFKDSQKNRFYDLISKRLKEIDKKEILFLSNIDEINWKIGDISGFVKKQTEKLEENRAFIKVETHSKSELYELYTHCFEIAKKELNCKIVFLLNDNKEHIALQDKSFLHVFFPTVITLDLKFLIHAPYKTTPNRETIDFLDIQNLQITQNIVSLYKDIVLSMSKNSTLNINTLALLPIYGESATISRELFNASVELFKTYPLIPTTKNDYALAENIFLLHRDLNMDFFHDIQIANLFDKQHLVSEDVYLQTNNRVNFFLTAYLRTKEYSIVEILDKFDVVFLSLQADGWIANLYEELSKDVNFRYIENRLNSYNLARLKDGRHIPFKSTDLKLQVYLNFGKESRFQSLNQHISVMEKTKAFLQKIGVKEPDILDEIKTFILPKLQISSFDEDFKSNYLKNLNELFSVYAASVDEKDKISALIKETPIFLANKDDKKSLQKSSDIYLATDAINLWFKNNSEAWIVDKDVLQVIQSTNFIEIGKFKITPQIINIPLHITQSQKEQLHKDNFLREHNGDDYNWLGLEKLLEKQIDENLSLVIWSFLSAVLKNSNILRGCYRWYAVNSSIHEKEFHSKISTLLSQKAWLFDTNFNLVKPTDIKTDALNEIYRYEELNIEIKEKLELLGFKTDIIKELEKNGFKIIPPQEVEMYEQFKKSLQKSEKSLGTQELNFDMSITTDIEFESNIEPNIEANIIQMEFKSRKPRNFKYQSSKPMFDDEDIREHLKPISKEVLKNIGDWSEKYVHNYLINFCKKNSDKNYYIKCMNENGNVGVGYDFVLMQDAMEIRYIEVKGHTNESSSIELTKAQWEFAKSLYDNNEGQKYSVFLIQNAKKLSAKMIQINNPVKMFIEDRLTPNGMELIYNNGNQGFFYF